MDPGIGIFANYHSLLTSRQSLVDLAGDPRNQVCLALGPGGKIVAYCVRRVPPAGERWAEMAPPILHEVLGESARGWRDQKLMTPLLELVCGDPANDDRILYIVGYSWTWDLEATGKTVAQYRETIIHLLARHGFRPYPTNEPNVCLRPENLFMARLGANLDRPLKRRFTNLLFAIKDD